MSLFPVSRYLGEEDGGNVSKESRSQAFLAKLKQKAKEKQKQSLTEQEDTREDRGVESTGAPEHKDKKRKSGTEPALVSDPEEPAGKRRKDGKEKKKKRDPSGLVKVDIAAAETEGQEDIRDRAGAGQQAQTGGFRILGGFENKAMEKVHRVLPQWLAQPDLVHRDIKSHLVPVSDVPGLSARLLQKIQMQAEVIPAILESAQTGFLIGRGGYKPRDICVSAPTGSGKTLAFVIPVIQVLMERVVCEVRALAVLPTKELAQQVCKVFSSYAEGTSLKVVMLAGQKTFAAEQASLSESRGGQRRCLADVVVATPGRLVDHINKSSGLNLEHLRFLIIDEADRMIDSMHQSWLHQVTKAVFRPDRGSGGSIFRRTEPTHVTAASVSAKRPSGLDSLSPPQMPLQKLLFSATLTQNPEKLQQLGLHQPRLFSSVHGQPNSSAAAPAQKQERFHFPQGLTEFYVPCTLSKKPLLVLHFFLRMKLSPVLCFTNSRETAHRLFLLVQLFGGVQAAEFSSRLSPGERKKTLKEFEQGKIQLLISTDAAARGIDVHGVKCVLNYDAPQYIRTYIHRIGRTARAGKAGLAFTFLLGVQEKNFLQMVEDAGSPGVERQIVKPESLRSMEARYEQTLQELAHAIKDEKT